MKASTAKYIAIASTINFVLIVIAMFIQFYLAAFMNDSYRQNDIGSKLAISGLITFFLAVVAGIFMGLVWDWADNLTREEKTTDG